MLESLSEAINEEKSKNKEGKSSWIAALVFSIFVILLTGVFGLLAWRKGRKMAKLQHAADKAKEAEHQATVDVSLAQDALQRQEAMEAAEGARQDVQRLTEAQEAIQRDYEETRVRLDAIVSWDDVDAYLNGR